jgi:hypothetical protein
MNQISNNLIYNIATFLNLDEILCFKNVSKDIRNECYLLLSSITRDYFLIAKFIINNNIKVNNRFKYFRIRYEDLYQLHNNKAHVIDSDVKINKPNDKVFNKKFKLICHKNVCVDKYTTILFKRKIKKKRKIKRKRKRKD